jgi:hypothetical protein
MSWLMGLLISCGVDIAGSIGKMPVGWLVGVSLGLTVLLYPDKNSEKKDNPFDVSDIMEGIRAETERLK